MSPNNELKPIFITFNLRGCSKYTEIIHNTVIIKSIMNILINLSHRMFSLSVTQSHTEGFDHNNYFSFYLAPRTTTLLTFFLSHHPSPLPPIPVSVFHHPHIHLHFIFLQITQIQLIKLKKPKFINSTKIKDQF